MRGRLLRVQGAGQRAVPQGQHHLDDPGDADRGLGVPDVRLHRAEQQRPPRVAVAAVRGLQRLHLDRVAQRGTRAVRLDHVDVRGAEARVAQRLPDDPLLCGAVRGGQAVGGTVLIDRAAADDRQDRVAVALRVGEALDDDHADALGQGHAVRVVGERLAPPVGGERPLPY
nr:hypothetical protein GCM10020092_106980 [Actinoplanes digitatis]